MIYNGFKQQIGGQRMIDMDNQWLYGNHMGIEPMNMVFKQRMYGYVLVYIYTTMESHHFSPFVIFEYGKSLVKGKHWAIFSLLIYCKVKSNSVLSIA